MGAYLTFAFLNSELVNIKDERVKNGFECECVCPECGVTLAARNNATEREKHFYHRVDVKHKCGYESAIHHLIKKVFSENPSIFLPEYYYREDFFSSKKVKDEEVFCFDSVKVEVTEKNENSRVKVDAVGYIRTHKLHIEFANTHFVDKEKINKIKDLKIACIEVDISKLELDEEKVKKFLIDKNSPIYWLSNPHLDDVYKRKVEKERKDKEQKEIERQQEVKRKLDEYQKNSEVKVKKIDYCRINFCPVLINHLKTKLYKRHLDNKTIYSILNGAKWNQEFESRGYNGKFIRVNDKTVWVYPPDRVLQEMTKEEIAQKHTLYSGLNTIANEVQFSDYGNCEKCKYNVEIIKDKETDYTICNYK